ncbi:Homeobox-leucine zipper protein HAT9 [Platanthera zijinensis]|uniref:Homeobox-leucine zipper protein HAT9 n=1 Tax=Platanthera zijinensis TaxID=2320716 RepID=A0AAP0FY26_9ASPA
MADKEDSCCDTALSLGLCLPTDLHRRLSNPPPLPAEPSLILTLSDEIIYGRKESTRLSSPHSSVSSFSTTNIIKKERILHLRAGEEETQVQRGASLRASVFDEDDEEAAASAARKKLRLTKEQSALLEGRFKEHTTLNPKQKQTLAKQLNLRPRQIEVWFQNRRARTKLKQTEVDCDFLRRCCETLTEENMRLQKELEEMKALNKFAAAIVPRPPPFFVQLPAATLIMCPSCERIAGAGDNRKLATTNSADDTVVAAGGGMPPTQHFLINHPFAHSAPC